MKEPLLSTNLMTVLVEIYNDLFMEQFLSLETTEITTTSSTTAVGQVIHVDVPESEKSKEDFSLNGLEDDIAIIEKSLAPALGLSNIGSISSCISIQKNDELIQLKYLETFGYAIIEVRYM